MKLILLQAFLLCCTFSSGQVSIENKTVNGKKTGFWSEIIHCDTIDSKQIFRTLYNSDNKPLEAWSEGTYIKGLKEGFWKEYWVRYIPPTEYMRKGAIAKGSLKTIREYKKNSSVGLYVEYFRNGNIKVMGQFGNTDQDADETNKLLQWFFFDDTGQLMSK
jgi:antitoxin component YwqK of YwqJK toxin-antitoxin module